jgi:hypothetical protein
MEAAKFSETLVSYYKTTRRRKPEQRHSNSFNFKLFLSCVKPWSYSVCNNKLISHPESASDIFRSDISENGITICMV